MPKPSNGKAPDKPAHVRLLLMAGLATAPTFMEEFRLRLESRFLEETDSRPKGKLLFPYGDWSRRAAPQFLEIRRDLRLAFDRTAQSIGGKLVMESLMEAGPDDRVILIGHSGGGVAALHGARLLQELQPSTESLVIQIGSPRCRIPQDFQQRTAYYYAAKPNGKTKDPVCRLGSWGGWQQGGTGLIHWNGKRYVPSRIVPLYLAGGHADYFRTHLADEQGRSNMEKTLQAVWSFIREKLDI